MLQEGLAGLKQTNSNLGLPSELQVRRKSTWIWLCFSNQSLKTSIYFVGLFIPISNPEWKCSILRLLGSSVEMEHPAQLPGSSGPFCVFSLIRNRDLREWKWCRRAQCTFLCQLSSAAAFWDVTVGNKIYSLCSELKEEVSPKQTHLKGIFFGFYLLWVIEVASVCCPCSAGD